MEQIYTDNSETLMSCLQQCLPNYVMHNQKCKCSPHQVNYYIRSLMPCLETICMVSSTICIFTVTNLRIGQLGHGPGSRAFGARATPTYDDSLLT